MKKVFKYLNDRSGSIVELLAVFILFRAIYYFLHAEHIRALTDLCMGLHFYHSAKISELRKEFKEFKSQFVEEIDVNDHP